MMDFNKAYVFVNELNVDLLYSTMITVDKGTICKFEKDGLRLFPSNNYLRDEALEEVKNNMEYYLREINGHYREFVLELKINGRFYTESHQIDVFESFEKAKRKANEVSLRPDETIDIVCVEYDTDDDKFSATSVYEQKSN